MNNKFLESEILFFHAIFPQLFDLISKDFKSNITYRYQKKDTKRLNVQTETDVKVEKLLVSEIKKQFPKDAIFSEETYNDSKFLSQRRVWIIDPIAEQLILPGV